LVTSFIEAVTMTGGRRPGCGKEAFASQNRDARPASRPGPSDAARSGTGQKTGPVVPRTTRDVGPQGGDEDPYDLLVDGPYDAPTRALSGLDLHGYGYRWIRLSRSDVV
jgi:hypothetical protein